MNLLKQLQLKKQNTGACSGKSAWHKTKMHNEEIISYNPTTEKPIASVTAASADNIDAIIQHSTVAFDQWRQVPAPQRGQVIRAIGEKLRENKEALGSLVSLEMGKSKQEGNGEVQEMIDMADLAVGQSRMLFGKTMQSERPSHRMYEQWHPIGPVGVITAFNFPVAVWAWNAFIAAICGNTVIWKGSTKTPLCTIAIQHICNDVMADFDLPAVFSCFISNNRDNTAKLINDLRIPLISFTGSSYVGKKINTQVASRFGRTILECSGNNALIIDKTADLKLAIPAIVFGSIGTAGQRCTSTRRVFVHSSLFETVKKTLCKAYATIRIGDPLNEENHMGPLIDEDAVNKYLKAIDTLRTHQAEILCGGNRINKTGYFVEPTIVVAENDWPIVQTETFAPILYLMPFDTLDEAIIKQNSVPQGLSSALFTNHLKSAEQFLSSWGSDCGIANINIGTSGAEIGGAFGGEKTTGGGREAGSDAWKSYMRRQTNTINWSHDLPLAQGIVFNI